MYDRPFSQPKLMSSQAHFSQVPQADIPRSTFNRSHQYKTTFDAGDLVPFYVDEALPGDTFNMSVTTFARLATPVVPIMDNLYCDVFFFAVPLRLVWNNFQKFMGEQTDPGDSTDYLVPQISLSAGFLEGSLADYFACPLTGVNYTVNALPFRSYNLIYNEWFRDENMIDSRVVDKDDGPDSFSDYQFLAKRGKRHDYFTSCLPWPQKGPAVDLPLGTTAPIVVDTASTSAMLPRAAATNVNLTSGNASATGGGQLAFGATNAYLDPNGRYLADLTNATAATINQLREAFQMQKLFERDARGGTRYTEIIRSHFGVVSPDARLQRPEYLGGGSTMVNVSPIPQTSESNTTPQGNLAAMGTFSHHGIGFTKSFTEHCIVMGLMSVRADLTYQQGLNRMWSRSTRYDFYWPALSHIGEQAVLNQEIYKTGVPMGSGGTDLNVFGYQERYAEYRYKPSVITGKFRSDATGSLDVWHLAQDFSTLPVLDAAFINEQPPMDRVKAVTSEPDFLFDAVLNLKCARPMPVYSVPGLIDHF